MSKLDTNLAALNMHKVNNLLQLEDLCIVPETRTSRCNSSVRQHSSGLLNNQTCTINRKGSNAGQMEVGKESVQRGVHAHGGDNDTVGDGQVLDGEGLEEEGDLVGVGEGGIDGTEVCARGGGLFDVVVFLRVGGPGLGCRDWLVDRVDSCGELGGGLEGRHLGLDFFLWW